MLKPQKRWSVLQRTGSTIKGTLQKPPGTFLHRLEQRYFKQIQDQYGLGLLFLGFFFEASHSPSVVESASNCDIF